MLNVGVSDLNNKKNAFKKHGDFMIGDLIILELSLLIASFIRYHGNWDVVFHSPSKQFYALEVLVMAVAYLITALIIDNYKNILKNDMATEFINIVKQAFVIFMVTILLFYIIQVSTTSSRFIIFIMFPIYVAISLIWRSLRKKRLRAKLSHYGANKAMIVLASTDTINDVISNLDTKSYKGYNVMAAFVTDYDPKNKLEMYNNVPLLGSIKEMIDYATKNWVDSATIAIRDRNVIKGLKDTFEEMGVITHTVVAKIDQEDSEYYHKLGNYIVSSNTYRSIPTGQLVIKRIMDIIGGFIGCIITLLLTIIVGPMIFFGDPGPIFYSQDRVGKNGKTFKIYKFRSMYKDADQRKAELMAQNKMSDGLMFKMDDDPRIIGSEKKDKNGNPKGIGNFIRKTSIDEFPQFFNVLKGDMSLVGPRPPTVDEWQKYSPHHRKRISVRPGLTGMWQVSGRSEITDFEEVVRLDSEYIDTWTNSMDVMIILKTIKNVFTHEGAE